MFIRKTIIFSVVIIILIATAGTLYLFTKSRNSNLVVQNNKETKIDTNSNITNKKDQSSTDNTDGAFNSDETINTSDWQTYRSEEHGFEVRYPESWIMKEGVKFPTMNVPGVEFTADNISHNLAGVIFAKDQKEFSSMVQKISCESAKCTSDELKRNVAILCHVENNTKNIHTISIASKVGYRCTFVNKLIGSNATKQVILFQNDKNNFYEIECSGVLSDSACNQFLHEFILL